MQNAVRGCEEYTYAHFALIVRMVKQACKICRMRCCNLGLLYTLNMLPGLEL